MTHEKTFAQTLAVEECHPYTKSKSYKDFGTQTDKDQMNSNDIFVYRFYSPFNMKIHIATLLTLTRWPYQMFIGIDGKIYEPFFHKKKG